MRNPPPESAPLRVRVHRVLADTDPEDLGFDAMAYETVAVLVAHRLVRPQPVSVEEVGGLWAWAFGDDARLLRPPHRSVLDHLTRRLQQLQQPPLPSTAESPAAVSELGPGPPAAG